MDSYQQELQVEKSYLEAVLTCLRQALEASESSSLERRRNLRQTGREMWEETAHFVSDFEKLTEVVSHLPEVTRQSYGYASATSRAEKYRRMIETPYFGRFDLIEDGYSSKEPIYIGLGSVIEPGTNRVLVYDWRAPISSIFYRFEPGKVWYEAPSGRVAGEVPLKRQYKIRDSELRYFFDCSVQINDEMLQEVLAGNASPKMKSIVETIQKEQDLVIRDSESELVVVQGAAGSGKTSIALHRIAFLLYTGMGSHLGPDNICIISPNTVFSTYISSVLPELGEENVPQTTFDEIALQLLGDRFKPEARNCYWESLIASHGSKEEASRRREIQFKGSRDFARLLDRLVRHVERRMLTFDDVYYAGRTIRTRQQLKNQFLNDQIGLPIARRLKRMERIVLDAIHPLQKERLAKIEGIVRDSEGHEFDAKPFSRLLAFKTGNKLLADLRRSLSVDYLRCYKALFADRELFHRLAKGLNLPEDIDEILSRTKDRLELGQVAYEDCAPLLYLKVKIEGSEAFPEIRHVVVDEAQDYSPLQYEVLNLLFRESRFTVLGDVNQSIEKEADESLYEIIAAILGKKKSVKVTLNKSYRSSYEISAFAQRILGREQHFETFERHEAAPGVFSHMSPDVMYKEISEAITRYMLDGYGSVAVIGRTKEESELIYTHMRSLIDVSLVTSDESEVHRGAVVLSSYLAKGLEFDVVIVPNSDKATYSTAFDKQLLYIASTRALHRLDFHYIGEKSPLLEVPAS